MWRRMTRNDHLADSREAFVSITPSRFGFNAAMGRLAGVRRGMYVTVYVDARRFRLAFEFHRRAREGCWKLAGRTHDPTQQPASGLGVSAHWASRQLPWVAAVARLADPRRRRFRPTREDRVWVIQLCPAFERSAAREAGAIPARATGIYRYVRGQEGGAAAEIVYIGRGDIRRRLAEPRRAAWRFDRVEYSLVPRAADRTRWERYWLERHVDSEGELPEYNRVRGGGGR